MSEPRLGRVVTAMVTPFDEDLEVNYDEAVHLARTLVAEGSDALVLCGSTGEGFAMSDDEKLELFRVVAGSVDVPVIAGTSSSDTARSVALTKAASTTGVSAILATTPAYARPSQRGIAEHLGAMAHATTLPVMLYDIPSRTGRKISWSTTVSIVSAHSNVMAMKDASADLASAAHLKAQLGDALDLYSGDDSLTLSFMAIGAVGIVAVASHWAGAQFSVMVNAAAKGDWELAREVNERLYESYLFEGSDQYPNPLPAKAALRARGLNVGECRLPMGTADDELNARARVVLSNLAR